jgi:hypothetical protein
LHTSSNLPLPPQLLTHLLSKHNPQLPHFLRQIASTAPDPPSRATAVPSTANTTVPRTAAYRQLKPEPAFNTPPKTPQKPTASTSKSSPTDTSTIITDSTPVKQTDPLPDTKRTLFFLSQRTREQQLEAIHSNPYYLTTLNEWIDTLDSEELTESQQKLLPHLGTLQDLLQEGLAHFQNLAQQVAQLRATNNQLKEDNNRLSNLPHKDPSFSQLQTQYQELAETFNSLNQEYNGLQKEALELRSTAREKDNLRKELQRILAIFPDTENRHQLERNIEELRNTERNSNNLAAALTASLEDWENVGKLLAPESLHPFDAATKATQLLEQNNLLKKQLEKLRQHHRRLSDSSTQSRPSARMTEPTGTTSGMFDGELTPENVRTIWNQVPVAFRNQQPGTLDPTTAVELLEALRHVGQCRHPQQAAQVLGDDSGNQDWDTSLTQMDQLYHHQCPEPEETLGGGTSKLFRSSDVPSFKDDKDYDGFRGSLVSFLQSEDPPRRSEYGRALLRILSSIEAPSARVAAKNWNVQNLIRPTWEATCHEFLTALDRKFESQTILQDSKIAWMACRPKESEKPSEFFNRFEGLTSQLQDVQRRKNAPVLSDSIITERLLLILPRYLTNNARIHFAQQGRLMELQTPEELRKYFEVTWTYTPRPAATGHDTKSRFKTANASPAPANISPNNVKERQCGIIASYDTYPSVPNEARGSLMPDSDPAKSAANAARRHYCAQRKLCLFCRRPQSEHQASAPRFKPVTLQGNARPAPAQIQAPIPEQLQIEAAPLLDL